MITKEEMIEVMDQYFEPLFIILGGIAAVAIIAAAVWLVIVPFMNKRTRL